MASEYGSVPDFDNLPSVKDMPQGCAWGIFDKNGKKDHLGCLNYLTPSVIQEAFKEAREGVSISLNWPINALKKPDFMRAGLSHSIIDGKELVGFSAFDDVIQFNTQCSSQWDSLVHFAHQPTGLYYNGVSPSKEELIQEFGKSDIEKQIPTLNHWHDRGGLVGRGVLLDYRSYATTKGIVYDCFDAHAISVQDLEHIAHFQGTKLKHGDILIVRTGYTDELGKMSAPEQEEALGKHKSVGVAGNEETARWVWNHHFSAVACDTAGFEVMPPTLEEEGGRQGTAAELVLHQYFLSLFGLSIGELWDLKALGEYCAKVKKYSFLLTSVPLNVPGAVGSPPNALAIF